MKTVCTEFEHAILVNRVASRYCQAMEFPTEEALKKYLKDHPDADKSNHSVKKEESSKSSEGEKKRDSGINVEPARYAKGMSLVKPLSDSSGFKTRGHRLVEALGGRWTNRERGLATVEDFLLKSPKSC